MKKLVSSLGSVLILIILAGCGTGTNSGGPLDALPYPDTFPTNIPRAFYFADSTVVMRASLQMTNMGMDQEGRILVDAEIPVQVTNNSDSEFTLVGDRITIYSISADYPIETVGLDPAGSTQLQQTIPSNSDNDLLYTNSPLDGDIAITAPLVNSQIFAQIALLIDDTQVVLSSQLTNVQ